MLNPLTHMIIIIVTFSTQSIIINSLIHILVIHSHHQHSLHPVSHYSVKFSGPLVIVSTADISVFNSAQMCTLSL